MGPRVWPRLAVSMAYLRMGTLARGARLLRLLLPSLVLLGAFGLQSELCRLGHLCRLGCFCCLCLPLRLYCAAETLHVI